MGGVVKLILVLHPSNTLVLVLRLSNKLVLVLHPSVVLVLKHLNNILVPAGEALK